MSRTKLYTHDDVDGAACGVLGKLVYSDNIDIEYCSYKNINDKVKTFIESEEYKNYDKTYITDISINEETAKIIDSVNKKIYGGFIFQLFDHHKDLDHLKQYKWAKVIIKEDGRESTYNFDVEHGYKKDSDGLSYFYHSGTSLFFNHLCNYDNNIVNNIVYYFVELVRQYDTWTWDYTKKQQAKNLADVFGILGIKEFVESYSSWIKLLKVRYEDTFIIKEEHLELLKYKRKDIDDYINYKMDKVKRYLSAYGTVGVVICDRKDCTSELGNKMCNELDIEYAALIYDGGVALRSKGDFV